MRLLLANIKVVVVITYPAGRTQETYSSNAHEGCTIDHGFITVANVYVPHNSSVCGYFWENSVQQGEPTCITIKNSNVVQPEE